MRTARARRLKEERARARAAKEEAAAKSANGANGTNGMNGGNGAPSLLRVRVALAAIDPAALDQLQELFSSHPGRCKVAFELVTDDGSEATLEASSAVQADGELLERVREICGDDSVAVEQ